MNTQPHVLFICANNTGRSHMAAGWLRHLAGNSVSIHSAAAKPGHLNPATLAAMAEVGIDIDAAQPWQIEDQVLLISEVIITMGCGDIPLLFPRKDYENWDVTDPAGHDLDSVRAIRDDIRARAERLLTRLRSKH